MREFYNYHAGIAPYLKTKATSNGSLLQGRSDHELIHNEGAGTSGIVGEGDAAGGSVLQRVSSFHLLRSSLSTPRPIIKHYTVPVADSKEPEHKDQSEITPSWRLKDRMKTVGVGLVMALNVGTDPPDITKPQPCARLQCWMDPSSVSRAKAKEKIGERLEAQYANWQQQRPQKTIKYRRALDPTVEDVRALCLGLRRHARNERVLLHYNGHGVPRATKNGEIWVFDSHHTQYIPLCATDLRQWLGKPSIVVLDCSCAGKLIRFLTTPLETAPAHLAVSTEGKQDRVDDVDARASQWVKDTIVLCPTAANEWLPMHPDYPADIFTSCLTTPIQMALRWFVRRNPQSMQGLSPDDVNMVPGKANDRKTPLGELNWIFTAVTDSIAWNVLPKPLFQCLFRQDLMVASMFRNFLLADRILRSLNCSPQSFPPLPPGVCDHPLWQAWDLACETCLTGLMRDGIIGNSSVITPVGEIDGEEKSVIQSKKIATRQFSSISSPFFSEQLTDFEIWLEFASVRKNDPDYIHDTKESPEQLPVVLQILLFQAHRVRALMLLRQFLDLGPWAVNLSLSLGIHPYVTKLLQSPENKQNLVGIWAKILAFDQSCQVDLVKDGAIPHFIHHLTWGLSRGTLNLASDPREAAEQRTMAAFILAITCFSYPQGQTECMRLNLHGTCCALLSSMDLQENTEMKDHDFLAKMAVAEQRTPPMFRLWLCLCLGTLMKDNNVVQNDAYGSDVHLTLIVRMGHDDSPDVRAAACYGLGCILSSSQVAITEKGGSALLESSKTPRQHTPSSSSFPVRGGPMQPNMAPNMLAENQQMPSPRVTSPGFPGYLQPTFETNSLYGIPWNSQQVQGSLGGHAQEALAAQSIPHNQNAPTAPLLGSASPIGLMGGGLLSNPPRQQSEPTFLSNKILPIISSPIYPSSKQDPRQSMPSVFDDRRRVRLDLEVMDALIQATSDASSLVRYEAAVSLACGVEKYLDAFLVVSEEMALALTRSETHYEPELNHDVDSTSRLNTEIEYPHGVDRETLERFGKVWKTIKDLKQNDPHCQVASATNSIVSYVHENILFQKMQTDPQATQSRRIANTDGDEGIARVASIGRLSYSEIKHPARDGPQHRLSSDERDVHTPLRRISSELGGSMLRNRNFRVTSVGTADLRESVPIAAESPFTVENELPKSELLSWKRSSFVSIHDEFSATDNVYDPLSPRGASIAYQARRRVKIMQQSQRLSNFYESLNPKQMEKSSINPEVLLESEEEKETQAEVELSSKKNTLQLKQTMLLKNEAQEMTSILTFHPCEDFLVVCHGQDKVSLWNTNSGSRHLTFSNGNPKGSRMTSSCWINAMSNSLFAIGTDDGSIRVFSGLDGKHDGRVPILTSAFFALSDMNHDSRGSGLVLEWQQYYGRLVAGGESKVLQCWDLGAEKCLQTLSTQTEACVTTISTAWNESMSGSTHFVGIGPDVVVAGFSDGAIRTFDLRTPRSIGISTENRFRGSQTNQHYKEHGSWIVSTAFTSYGGNHEIVSGSISGEVKIWDLRFSASIRTHNVQRSQMTALAIHPLIPLIATGSHAQFIKLFSLDGDTLEIIRFHEEMAGHRIGPVGCLSFHPHKPVLACGGTDGIVGIYAPKNPAIF